MADIVVKGLGVAYGEKKVFEGLDVTFFEDKINVVLGSSGVGKTTLLNAVAGLVPYTGEITRGEGEISYIFQKDRLIPHISVRKNLDLVIKKFLKSAADRRKAVDEMLQKLEIADQADKLPTELSGGQAQRVSMARAFLYPSRVLLMDEPFRALDPALKIRLLGQLDELLKESPRTVVYVTHDVDECVFAADSWRVLSGTPAVVAASGLIDIPRGQRGADSAEISRTRAQIYDLLCAQNCD